MQRLLLLCLLSLSGLLACTVVHRTEQSGYANRDEQSLNTVHAFYQERLAQRYREAANQLGLDPRQSSNESDVVAIRNRIMLSNLEKRIPTQMEKKQYYDLKPYMESDLERIQFLSLPDSETKARWAQSRSIASVQNQFDYTTQTIIEKNDIMKGMTRQAVKQSWGEPDSTEVAGNPIYGNERWVYKKLVASEAGYKHETRYVYFETGRVAGWETLGIK